MRHQTCPGGEGAQLGLERRRDRPQKRIRPEKADQKQHGHSDEIQINRAIPPLQTVRLLRALQRHLLAGLARRDRHDQTPYSWRRRSAPPATTASPLTKTKPST